ncbi:auxin-induced protein 6B-like [Neltuma alba]|uniref:auxin-induced protein 6B-like n=1 Tax=Neltuma alba TaxID=207710 RepID=UPI0010A3A85C|nr:auxin-induced protein 6B-like [Prosopis alba]XP_028756925.1 auxin-induced protein 6B-like [Prosopis alba]
MAKLRNSSGKKKGGIVKLKVVVEKIQKKLLPGMKGSSYRDACEEEEGSESSYVPEDVKEGHFAVIAEDGEEPRRFVVPLSCLTHPSFLRLLEEAAEEYGFDHEGALTIPCSPRELERILEGRSESDAVSWNVCKPMVQTYS